MTRYGLALLTAALLAVGCTDDVPPLGPLPGESVPPTGDIGAAATLRLRVEGDVPGAVDVLRRRLAALDLVPRDTRVEGSTVTFELPRAASQPEVAGLVRPARLTFHPVLRVLAADAPAPGATAGSCADPAYRASVAADLAAAPIVACDAGGSAKYVLGPPEEVGAVRSARATNEADGIGTEWGIQVELADTRRWEELTRRFTDKQLAIVVDGEVQSAPTVLQPIPNGAVFVSGKFSEGSARLLAAALQSGPLEARVVAER